MTHFIQMAFLTAFTAAITACGPGPSECEGVECDNSTTTDTDCCDGETKFGEMEIIPTIDGVREECTFEWNGDRYFTVDGPKRVPVGTHDVFVGNPDLKKDNGDPNLTIDGSLKHISDDDREWFADEVNPAVRENELTTTEVPLSRYFEGNWACSRDEYLYDKDAHDFKGEHDWYSDDPVQHIYVQDSHKVYAEDSPTMAVMGGSDYMEVYGNHLFLVVDDGDTTYILTEEIGQDSFFITFVTPSGTGTGVKDLYCEKQ